MCSFLHAYQSIYGTYDFVDVPENLWSYFDREYGVDICGY